MSLVVRWEAPPASDSAPRRWVTRTSKLAPLADELRERPGEWALVFVGASGKASAMATHISRGQLVAFTPTGDFEACTRQRDGVARTYARYVGDDS